MPTLLVLLLRTCLPESVSRGLLPAAVTGHAWPLFHGFRGGEAVGRLFGARLLPRSARIGAFLAVGLLAVVVSAQVGLAALSGVSPPLAALRLPGVFLRPLPVAAITALLIAFIQRRNARRLVAGNEHGFERLRPAGRCR